MTGAPVPKPEVPVRQFVLMMWACCLCYLAMAMPLSSLSVQVTRGLGMSNVLGGLAAGAAFITTLIRRKPAGDLADCLGGKHCFLRGCLWYTAGSAVCLAAALEALPPSGRLAALILGRLIMGVGESLTNAGMVNWGIGVMGIERTGRVLASIGMAMYGAVAIGGQAGFFLYENIGFGGLIAISTLAPVSAYFLARPRPEGQLPERRADKSSYRDVLGRIWRMGVPATLHAIGYGVLGAFLAKTFLDRGWEHAGMGLTSYGIGYVAMRVLIGHLPDRIGGHPVAILSGGIEMAGLYLLFLAPGPASALLGAALTGAGCSMIFPSLAMEIARANPVRLRGACLSSFAIFQDVSYGFAGAAAGLFVDRFGDRSAYLFAALAATAGTALVARLALRRRTALREGK